jgi:hypothetical protein
VLTEDAVTGSASDCLAADGWGIVSLAMPNRRCIDLVSAWAGICKDPRKLESQCATLDRGSGDHLLAGPGAGLALPPRGTLGRG